jgi:hypothetical protein
MWPWHLIHMSLKIIIWPCNQNSVSSHVFVCGGINFASFYNFDIWFWNYSDSVVFFVLCFIPHSTSSSKTNFYSLVMVKLYYFVVKSLFEGVLTLWPEVNDLSHSSTKAPLEGEYFLLFHNVLMGKHKIQLTKLLVLALKLTSSVKISSNDKCQ